jgi:hypothetical protein
VGVPQHFDLFDARRVQGEGSLYTDTVSGNTPHSEIRVGAAPSAHAHDGASHQLNPLPVALNDAVVDLNIITYPRLGKI